MKAWGISEGEVDEIVAFHAYRLMKDELASFDTFRIEWRQAVGDYGG